MTPPPPSKMERRRRARAARDPRVMRCVPSSTLCSAEVEAEAAHVEHREGEGDEKDDHGERGTVAELEILQKGVERVERNRLRRRAGASAGHDVDQIEDSKRVECAEDQCDEDRRLEERNRYA